MNHQDTRKESLSMGTPGTSSSMVESDLLLEVRQSGAEVSGCGLSSQEITDESTDTAGKQKGMGHRSLVPNW